MIARHIRASLFTLVLTSTAASGALAESAEYDFKDPKGVNTVAFVLDSVLEPIFGVATGTGGKILFDPEHPEATTGTITVDAKTMHVPNLGMKRTIHNAEWLNVSKHKTIEFTFKKVTKYVRAHDGSFELMVVGDFTCKGITKEITVPVSVMFLPGQLSSRTSRLKGDLLVLRSKFSVDRRDYNIKPDMGGDVVATEVEIRISIAGGHVRK